MKDKNLNFATLAVHAGQSPDPSTGAIMTPVFQTSTFRQKSPGQFIENYDYSRSANPTRTALEANLAALEGVEHGVCFSSGLASISAVVHLLKAGDHVVMSDDVYGGTFRLFEHIFKQLGIDYTMVDMTDADSFTASFKTSTKLVWVETPTNPMLKIIDLRLAAELAKKNKAYFAVDNTFATPYLQRPFDFDADIVSHSTTKYIGGHSDLVGGVLMVKEAELAERLRYIQNAYGAVPAPWDCFLQLRSTKTLSLRMERHCHNAKKIVEFLEAHSKIEKVIYPGLEGHPQHEIAKQQMKDFGGMISCVIAGGPAQTKTFLEKLKLFSLAESLGAVESMVNHPAIMTHASVPAEQRTKLGISDSLIRFSVGIEDSTDLIADLDQALA